MKRLGPPLLAVFLVAAMPAAADPLSFDAGTVGAPAMPHRHAGHFVGRHPEAAAGALAETRAFFAERLGP